MPRGLAHVEAVQTPPIRTLGRLVPLSRAIYLADDCRSLDPRERPGVSSLPSTTMGGARPCATIIIRTVQVRPTRVILPASIEKAVCGLNSMPNGLGQGRPKPFRRSFCDTPDILKTKRPSTFRRFLVADRAKLVDTTESVFHLPKAMLGEPSQRVIPATALGKRVEFRLKRAVSVYHKELGDNLHRPELKDRRRQIQSNAVQSTSFGLKLSKLCRRSLGVANTPGV